MKKNNKQNVRNTAKARKRHLRTYKALKILLSAPAKKFFKFTNEPVPEIEGNYLLLSNHNTDFDFFFTSISFPEHMYYVASEHVYQKGFLSKLLLRYLAPIARVKGTTASATVMSIIRTLRGGSNVAIFAEGNRSFNGETCPILLSTGKLARSCGVSLVTYRLERAYLATPRWANSLRRGPITGRVVNVYSPEQLRSMSEDEVNEAIRKDLYENAYARQEEEMIPFKGKKLAEGLEHILHICPQCGGISTIKSHKNKISCKCGFSAVIDKFGFFIDSPYKSVLEWDNWQKTKLPEIIANAGDQVFFSDANVEMYAIGDGHKANLTAKETMSMDRSNLYIGSQVFPLSEISGLGIYSKCNMVFEHNDNHYELKMDKENGACAVKYVRAYDYLTNEDHHYTI